MPWSLDAGPGPGLDVPLVNTRQVVAWIEGPELMEGPAAVVPAFFMERENGVPLYGIPTCQEPGTPKGIKAGFHGDGQACTPDFLDRVVKAEERQTLEEALSRVAPGVAGVSTATSVCMYTNTPDGHFIIDRLPGSGRTVIGCGFCGHGFKFAPVVGKYWQI